MVFLGNDGDSVLWTDLRSEVRNAIFFKNFVSINNGSTDDGTTVCVEYQFRAFSLEIESKTASEVGILWNELFSSSN